MYGWTKFYIDGTKYVGADTDRSRTWRNSRSEGLIRVDLEHGDNLLSIAGTPGEYWQSDDYAFSCTANTSTLTTRRIQKLIARTDNFIGVQHSCSSRLSVYLSVQPPNKRDFDMFRAVRTDETGKWLTLEYKVSDSKVLMYFSDRRI